jgi:hypothetical protein
MHAGKISHVQALTKAQLGYEKRRAMQINLPSLVKTDFENAIKQLPKRTKERR